MPDETDNKKLSGIFKLVGKVHGWQAGTHNLDIGGGASNKGSEFLAKVGITNWIYDLHNRSESENRLTLNTALAGMETVTLANVLNVIPDKVARLYLLHLAHVCLRAEGTTYVIIYEGDGSGVGNPTSRGWQANRKLETYVEEIRRVFPCIYRKGKLLWMHK